MDTSTQLIDDANNILALLRNVNEKDPSNEVRKAELRRAFVETQAKLKQVIEEKKKNAAELIKDVENLKNCLTKAEQSRDDLHKSIYNFCEYSGI